MTPRSCSHLLKSAVRFSLLWILLLPCACEPAGDSHPRGARSSDASGGITSEALASRGAEGASTLFEKLSPRRTGIDLVSRITTDPRWSLLNNSGFVCGGVCIGDVNADGRPDLFFASGPDQNRLYIQVEDFRFKDIAGSAGLGGGEAWGTGVAMVDIEGDGDLDVYVCNYDAPNQLFVNEGRGETFTESARRFGLDLIDASLTPAFADYDEDGDLDLFVLTYRYYRPGGRPARPPVGYRGGKPYVLPEFEKYYALRQVGPEQYTADTCGRPDRLYRNDGDGTFSDVSAQAGITQKGYGLSATWWDYNGDGLLDLYVGNDFMDPDHLYRNDGDGTFSDVIADVMPYTTWSSMGADCGDINNDGLLDFMSVDMAATTHYKSKITMGDMGDRRWFLENAWPRQTMRNVVYLHTGTDRFMEVAFLAGLASTDWTWAVKMADFDNDGRVDVFASNGMSRMTNDADVTVTPRKLIGQPEWELWKDKPVLAEANLAFRNRGDLEFENVSAKWGLDHVGMSFATAYGDLDGDGDLDLVVVNLDEPVSIYRNRDTTGHRVIVQLAGVVSHQSGTGAVVRVEDMSGRHQVRQMNPMTGFQSGNAPEIHFGLGETETIDRLTVTWPSGRRQSFRNLAANRRYAITEPSGPASAKPSEARTPSVLFTEVSQSSGLVFKHQETPYDDYARQPLLPGKHSQLGGGLAWGNADGDGDEDLFVAGAAGQAGRLFLAGGRGRFEASDRSRDVLEADRASEDMAPLWLDADSDGNLDLLVTSGGVEHEPGDRRLEDRLYLNDGKARLSRAPRGTLPPARVSSGVAVAGDIDGDGDLDLFIGGRVVPGRYPETPDSRLLRNDGGRFTNITDTFAPGLRTAGMVTGALWSDANGDGRVDLLVCLEWGPVRLFENSGSRLEDQTGAAGLGRRLGWWNSITGADIDHDGDTDYIVMNVGLNTKYGAPTDAKPALLYYGDMEGNGRRRLIEAKPDKNGLVPVRGRSCSSGAMPMVAERFPTYRDFARSLLPEIYTERCLDEALRMKANHFESGVLVNDGAARFAWRSLPRLAQASPGYGVVAADLDGDGDTDIHAVQNLYTREPETGLWRGGIGVTVSVDKKGELRVLSPARTGLVVDGDAKGLTLCDLDGDTWPDLACTQNDGRLLVFRNRGSAAAAPLAIELRGRPGNPTAVGARVAVVRAGGQTEAAEVYAGGGYLSQSTARLFFAAGGYPITINVRWPDARRTTTRLSEGESRVVVDHPDR